MSRTVDERVVEMRFDNKQFEAGAKQTVGTLSRLKEALELPDSGGKALEGLDKAVKGIKLDGLSAGVEALEKRFSTMGIVGMRIIENITDGLTSKLYTAVNFVTNSIVSGGIKRAMNIENAHFQLQALLKDEAKVQAVMADAMESVDGTAYAYDEAAKAASQFAASGIQAGEEMLGALKGITGVAAMTNSSFEDVSRIFTTVAGNGRLMGDQLLQLSSRGLNAASTLADYFREVRGQANMTEGEIREMVSKGKISFKDFSDAMTWAFGDSAKRANETFTGAMSNMKSALARIGAGFISPLVEQNGELVQLFNALRIKINDVKSALVFDEQRSAISGLTDNSNLLFDTMTKIVKNGSVGFDEVTSAILGTTKSEEELSKINSKLTESFEEVKETGYASSEVLMKFTKNGINAYGSLQSYINGILDGTIRVSDATKDTLRELTNGIPVSIKDIDNLAKEGKISFDTFSEAIIKTSGIVETETKFTSDTIKNMISEVKASGSVTTEALMEFRKNGMNAYTALRDYMNGVLDGSVRASYATKQAIEEITEGTSVGIKDIENLTKEGKISFDIFQSAMEKAYGTEKTLSKQFTDTFQDMIKNIVKVINETDVTKPMEIFYYWVESVKNVTKGLLSVINPVAKAFGDVFFIFNSDDIITFSKAVEQLTSKMKLSEKNANNFREGFTGIFKILKGIISIFTKIGGISIKPLGSLVDILSSFIKFIGVGLVELANWLQQSPLVNKSIELLSKGLKTLYEWGSSGINYIRILFSTIKNLPATERIIKSLTSIFDKLGEKFSNSMDLIFKNGAKFKESVEKNFPEIGEKILNIVANVLEAIANLLDNDGVKGAKSASEIFAGIFDGFINSFGDFKEWFDSTVAPFFKDFTFDKALKGGTDIGIIYVLLKLIEVFKDVTKPVQTATSFLETFQKLVKSIGQTLKDFSKNIGIFTTSLKKTFSSIQKNLKASAFLKIAESIFLLAAAIFVLSLADMKKAWQSVAMLSILIGLLNITLKETSKMNPNSLKPIKDAVLLFVSIGLVLFLLSRQPWESILAASFGLSLVLMSLTGVFKILSSITINKKTIKMFNSMVLALVPISLVLVLLTKRPWESVLAAGVALSGTILIFALVFKIISAIRPDQKAIGSFILASIGVAIIGLTLAKMAEQPWENLLGAAISLSAVLLAMSGALAILTIAGSAVGPALIGIALLDVLIADLALVLWALGNIFKSDDAKELLSGGLDILVLLGKALGDFVGAIIGGIITGISSSLPQIGLDLSAFMTNLQEFLNGAKNIDGSTLASIGFLAATLIALTAAEVIAGLASLFGLSLIPLAAELSGFMIGLTPFILISRTIKPESMEACKSLAEMIIILTSAQLLSGIGRFFGLTGKLSDFAAELNAFAPAIADFAEKVKDVKPEAVEGAAAAASIMAEVAGKLQGHGGIFQKIVGEKNLAAFAEELNAFAPAIAEFSERVKDVDPASVEGAKSAAMIMAEVANKLPNSGGLSAKIFGDNKLSDFGRELAAFASYVPFFIQAFSNVSPFSVIGVAAVTEIMSTLANGLPNSGGVVSWFTGDNDISKFGQKLVSFGENVKKFSDSVTEIDETKISSVVEEIKKLVALTTEISSLKDSEISSFAVVLIKTGSSGIDGLVKTFTDSKKKVEDAVEIMIKYLTEALKSKYFDVYRAGITIIEHLLSAINNGNSDFYKAGSNAGEGFIKGLNDKVNSARNAGAAIGKAAYEALKKSLDEHSPSKKTAEAGLFAGEGFINALLKYVSEAYKTGSEIGEESIKGINYGIESLGINNSLEPTIKPIMDLSDIRRNADEITSLFNSSINVTKGYALSASVDFVKRDDKYQELMNQTKGMISDMNSRYEDQVKQVSKSIDKLSKRPINVSVSLEGEAAGVFKLVRQENDKFIETAHYNPLSKTTVTTRRS